MKHPLAPHLCSFRNPSLLFFFLLLLLQLSLVLPGWAGLLALPLPLVLLLVVEALCFSAFWKWILDSCPSVSSIFLLCPVALSVNNLPLRPNSSTTLLICYIYSTDRYISIYLYLSILKLSLTEEPAPYQNRKSTLLFVTFTRPEVFNQGTKFIFAVYKKAFVDVCYSKDASEVISCKVHIYFRGTSQILFSSLASWFRR